MSFTYNLATPLGKLRLKIQDKNEAAPKFQDEELTAFLDEAGGNVLRAAATACDALALMATQRPTKTTYGDESETWSTPAEYIALAENFRRTAVELSLQSGLQTGSIAPSGELLDGYMPLWHDQYVTGGLYD